MMNRKCVVCGVNIYSLGMPICDCCWVLDGVQGKVSRFFDDKARDVWDKMIKNGEIADLFFAKWWEQS